MKVSLLKTASNTPTIEEIALRLISDSTDDEPAELWLTNLAGRVVVLFVFGIDCGTCKHLARLLSDFRAEFAPQVEFIGISVQSGCEERLEAFRRESGTQLKLAHCSTRLLYPALHIPPGTWLFYPTLIFIDQKQRMRGYFVGGGDFFADTEVNLRMTLNELLREWDANEFFETDEKVEARL
jgi:thiol-disulfide isomerase/thioredoxin